MKKLFISQPMKGKTDQEILRERENNKYVSFIDFVTRTYNRGINKKIFYTIIKQIMIEPISTIFSFLMVIVLLMNKNVVLIYLLIELVQQEN